GAEGAPGRGPAGPPAPVPGRGVAPAVGAARRDPHRHRLLAQRAVRRRARDRDAVLAAARRVDEIELDLRLDVAAAALAAAAAPAAPREEVREEVVDALELEALRVATRRLEAAGRGTSRPAAEARRERIARAPRLLRVEAALERHLAELVVVAPLRRVGEHVVGAGDVLELVLGGLVAGVHIGVVA